MATDPVWGSDFLVREDMLALLNKRLVAFKKGYRQNMALVGPPAVGKSSILRQFISESSDKETIPIFVEVPQGSLELFIKRFMASSLMSLLKLKDENIPWDVTSLIQTAKKYVPKTVDYMRASLKLVNKKQLEEAYKKVLELPNIIREETGCQIILVLDAFNYIDTLSLRNPFGALGKQIMVDKDTMYVVASSKPLKTKAVFREKLNLLFGNFEILEISTLDYSSARKYVKSKIHPFQLDLTLENFIIHFTDSHPFYMSVMLERGCELLKQRNKTIFDREIFFQTCVDELLNSSGRIHQYFESLYTLSHRAKNLIHPIQILVGIALGHRKISRLAQYLGRKVVDVKKSLQLLLDEEVIHKEGRIFLISDLLLKFWLKQVVMVGVLGVETDMERRTQYFIRQLDLSYAHFLQEQQKDIPQRVEELFSQFRGEVVQIGSSKLICTAFDRVVSKTSNGRIFPVKGLAAKGSWICQISNDPIKEDDIHFFLNETKEEKTKGARKIMVALGGIDLNAILMAKNAKISVWDLKSLNRLLDVYERPKVII